MKTILSVCFSFVLILQSIFLQPINTDASEVAISSPSSILVEASTGQIIFEKNADEKLPPASVTKIMTLLLIFDALQEHKIKLEDMVTVSEYAASMGGSQVFFEPGETQNVDTMIKCIAVASANDACVAIAEHIATTEEEFVKNMNLRAKELGMNNTNFVNCNGLDAKQHLTTAKDIALMSRELLVDYPQIHDYSTIWMENIIHTTAKGNSEFGLTNTNKLIRQYEYTTGLKTGSTNNAKFCISATAKKNDMELIAVIMAAPDPKTRFADATSLLNFGFETCSKYIDHQKLKMSPVSIKHGVKKSVTGELLKPFQYIETTGADMKQISRKIKLKKELQAPVKKGDQIGEVHYYIGKTPIGHIPILAKTAVSEINYKTALFQILESFFL